MEQRRAGVNYEFGSKEMGNLSISLVSMRQDEDRITGAYTPAAAYGNPQFVEVMPRIDLAYFAPVASARIGLSFLQSAVMANTSEGNDKFYNFNAYHVMAGAKPMISDDMYVAISGFYGVNMGVYNFAQVGSSAGRNKSGYETSANPLRPILKPTGDVGEMDDTSAFGGAIAFGGFGGFELGFGYQSASNDQWDEDITGMGGYVQYGVKLSPNFTITPEVGFYKFSQIDSNAPVKDGNDQQVIQAGVQMRVDI